MVGFLIIQLFLLYIVQTQVCGLYISHSSSLGLTNYVACMHVAPKDVRTPTMRGLCMQDSYTGIIRCNDAGL